MYDLLNTQARLSRQKEHLQLPKRHTLHPGAWLARVLCVKRCWVFLALTETLGSWGGSELAEDVQSIAEDAQHLRALGTVEQTLGDAILSLGASRKMVSLFLCYLGAGLTFFCAHAASWQFAVEENQSLTRSTPWAPLCSGLPLQCHQLVLCSDLLLSASKPQPISLFSLGCFWGAPQPVSVSCAGACCGAGRRTGDRASWCWWLPWQRKAAVCVSCPSPELCSSVWLLRLSLPCL